MNSTTKSTLFLIALFTLATLTGCSTIRSLFGNDEPEDYNALTYGNEYSGNRAHSSWAEDRAEDEGRAKKQVSDAEEEVEEDDRLDPHDDQIRGEIESRRGLASSRALQGLRTTRVDFYDQAVNDGSLWSNENDANYFFTKGKVRATGDIVSVKMEDQFIKQIAEEIKKTLTPAEQEVEMAIYRKNSVLAKDDKDVLAYRNVASDDLNSSAASDVMEKMEKSARWAQVDLVPSLGVRTDEELRAEVIDRFPNGNYKVRAIRRVLYRGTSRLVSLVAVAPANDFDDRDLIPSGKLYEYKIKVAR